MQLVSDAPIVEALAQLDGRAVEEGALLRGERDRRCAAKLRPVGRAAEQLGVPADGAGLERLALGLGDGGHDAFERAIGGQRDVFAFDLGKARHEHERGNKPAEQRPPRKDGPMEMTMDEAHLRAEGENGGGERPKPKRRAIHRKRKQSSNSEACEDQLSHGRPPNSPWSLSVPGRRASCGQVLQPARSAPIRLFALYGPVGHRLKSFCAS